MGWEALKGSFPAADNRHEHPLSSRSVDVSALLAGEADLDFGSDPLRELHVGGAGNIKLKLVGDSEATTWACQAGQSIRALIGVIVYSGTTATLIVGGR